MTEAADTRPSYCDLLGTFTGRMDDPTIIALGKAVEKVIADPLKQVIDCKGATPSAKQIEVLEKRIDERLTSMEKRLDTVGKDFDIPVGTRQQAAIAASGIDAFRSNQTAEGQSKHLSRDTSDFQSTSTPEQMRLIVDLINSTSEDLHVDMIKHFSENNVTTNLYAKFLSVFSGDISYTLSLKLLMGVLEYCKDCPLAKSMCMSIVSPHATLYKSMMVDTELDTPLPKALERRGYEYPVESKQPIAIMANILDDIELFMMLFDENTTPVTSPTLLEIACFRGSIQLATYLMTTSLLPKSKVLWYLALSNKFGLAKTLLFNNKAYTKMDRILLTAIPKNAATILEILTYHKNQPFIDACVEAGLINNSNKAEDEKNRGNQYYVKDQFKEAIECYSNAMQIDKPTHILFTNRSIAYFRLGQFKESLSDANDAIALQPDWIKAYLRKGDALDSLGLINESIEAYKSGLKLDPKHLEIHQKLQQVQTKKTLAEEDDEEEDDNIKGFNEVLIDFDDLNLQ
eukprot:gene7409-8664_t